MQFITIKEAQNITELLVLKSKLESEGIACRLHDELTSQVLNYLPVATVKLQVLDDELETVKKILEASGEHIFINKSLSCPNCGSEKVKVIFSVKNILKVFSIFFLSIITFTTAGNIFKSASYKCKTCNTVFKN